MIAAGEGVEAVRPGA